jgi:hypothetical protein
MAGESVHVSSGSSHVDRYIPDRLGAVNEGKDVPLAGHSADLPQRQHFSVRPVYMRYGDEARLQRQGGFELLWRHGGRDEVDLHPEAALEVVERYQAARVLCCSREDLVAFAPVYRADAEVHAVGGVLGEGHVVGPYEAGRGLASARVSLCLVGVEADALEVGGTRAEVIRSPHGPYYVVGGRSAAA